jgi:hypothetical protein
MSYLITRIILTIIGLIGIAIDCHNETVEMNDQYIHITIDIVKVIFIIAIWFI